MQLYTSFSSLIDYPNESFFDLVEKTYDALSANYERSSSQLNTFIQEIKKLSLNEVEELHAHTFYIAPKCIPYASIHLFGQQSHKRTDLMAKLSQKYWERDFSANNELPDHLMVLLRFIPTLSKEEKKEMINLILLPSIEKMIKELNRSSSIYEHVFMAIRSFLEVEYNMED